MTINHFFGKHRFLSNFHLCPPKRVYLPEDPEWYRSVEHAYQAAKFPLNARTPFRTCTPNEAKQLGKGAAVSDTWRTENLGLMLLLLRQKFREPYLCHLLLRTGDALLIEGNTWHDNFYGACGCSACSGVFGQNHLGRLLMLVRSELERLKQDG